MDGSDISRLVAGQGTDKARTSVVELGKCLAITSEHASLQRPIRGGLLGTLPGLRFISYHLYNR